MDILKREISRKRQQLEEKELLGGNKKYFKRSELAKKEEEAYFQRCGYKHKVMGKLCESSCSSKCKWLPDAFGALA